MDQSMTSTVRSSLHTGAPYVAPSTSTTTLNANHTPEFMMNSLISREYETTPLQAGHIPGCTVHVPAGSSVVGQRRAQATLHNSMLRPLIAETNGQWQDMQLVDLRPQERSYNKNYLYAENAPSKFLKFPKSNDHRRL